MYTSSFNNLGEFIGLVMSAFIAFILLFHTFALVFSDHIQAKVGLNTK